MYHTSQVSVYNIHRVKTINNNVTMYHNANKTTKVSIITIVGKLSLQQT